MRQFLRYLWLDFTLPFIKTGSYIQVGIRKKNNKSDIQGIKIISQDFLRFNTILKASQFYIDSMEKIYLQPRELTVVRGGVEMEMHITLFKDQHQHYYMVATYKSMGSVDVQVIGKKSNSKARKIYHNAIQAITKEQQEDVKGTDGIRGVESL